MPLTDTTILDWADDYLGDDTNAPTDSEDMAGLLDDQVRLIMSVVRTESENKMWERWGLTPTYVSATSFKLPGDVRATAAIVGRRVKVTYGSGTKYGTIITSTYSAPDTTVTVVWDLEEVASFTRVTDDQITIASDVTARFAAGFKCEFWRDSASSDRVVRVVSSSSYSAPNTTINFTTGDPYFAIGSANDRLMVPSQGIDNTVSEVAFGLFTPDLYQSGWPQGVIRGVTDVVANGTTGPFTVALPERLPNTSYYVLLQPISATSAPSSTRWAHAYAAAHTAIAFRITLPVAITAGPTLRYEYAILRSQ